MIPGASNTFDGMPALSAMPQSTPSPLWGGIKGGGGLAAIWGLSHPLPASPIKGEVPSGAGGRLCNSRHATGEVNP